MIEDDASCKVRGTVSRHNRNTVNRNITNKCKHTVSILYHIYNIEIFSRICGAVRRNPKRFWKKNCQRLRNMAIHYVMFLGLRNPNSSGDADGSAPVADGDLAQIVQ